MGPEGNIWISSTDTQRLSIFGRDGSHLRDIRFPRLPPFFIQTTSSGFYGLHVDQRLSDDRSLMLFTFSLRRFSADGELLNTLFTISDELDMNNMRMDGMSDKYPYYTIDNQGRIWQTRNRTDLYEINVYRPDGSLDFVVRKEFEPIRKSREEIEEETEVRRRMLARRFGDALPPGVTMDVEVDPLRPATGLPYFDPHGYIWIQVNREGVRDSNAFDLFDMEGQYLTSVVLADLKYPALLTFREDRLYLAEIHPLGEPQIAIYSISRR